MFLFCSIKNPTGTGVNSAVENVIFRCVSAFFDRRKTQKRQQMTSAMFVKIGKGENGG